MVALMFELRTPAREITGPGLFGERSRLFDKRSRASKQTSIRFVRAGCDAPGQWFVCQYEALEALAEALKSEPEA